MEIRKIISEKYTFILTEFWRILTNIIFKKEKEFNIKYF